MVLLLSTLALPTFAQSNENKRYYDYARVLHFGFTIGTNLSTFKRAYSDQWYHQQPMDTVVKVSSKSYPGITLGAVIDLHFGKSYLKEHFDLRLIPSLVLTQRRLVYTYGKDQGVAYKDVESALLEAPLLLKMKSDRFSNMRFYVIAGVKYSYDLSSNVHATLNPKNPIVAIYPNNYSYEFGTGLDLYFPYFKFSPEIKVAKGLNNVLVPSSSVYSGIFSSFKSNFVYFSLYFEG